MNYNMWRLFSCALFFMLTACALHAEALRFRPTDDGTAALLTYLSPDSLNASAYTGRLSVPTSVPAASNGVAAGTPVVGLGTLACAHCKALQSVTLAEGLTSVGYGAFAACPALTTLSLPASVTTLGDCACYQDYALTTFVTPQGVTRLGRSSFAYCTSLASLTLHNRLQGIAPYTFYYCASLDSLDLPYSLTAIGEHAFAYCTHLRAIRVYDSPIAITADVFEGVDCSQCTLYVPHDVYTAYLEADVWRDFKIVDDGTTSLEKLSYNADDYFSWHIAQRCLYVSTYTDAPALLYDTLGRLIATVPAHTSSVPIPLSPQTTYLLRCSKSSQLVALQ